MVILVKLIAIVGFAIMFVWTLITGRQDVPLTDRTQIVAVSEEEAAQLGANAFAEVLGRFEFERSGPAAERVRQVAGRIAAAAETMVENDHRWEAVLLRSDEVNAFALPGGKIAVLAGLLAVADEEDELAAVVGHEVAHVLARHGAERLTQEQLAEYGRIALSVAVGDLDPAAQAAIMGALGLGTRFGVLMPFSRTHETEADRIGLLLMARACYDPRAALSVWQDMAQAAGGGPPEFLSTHPSHGSRIESLQGWMGEAIETRAAAGCPPLEQA